eukprot:Nk52_evm42s78 gene=Nk52_evmTU42s78
MKLFVVCSVILSLALCLGTASATLDFLTFNLDGRNVDLDAATLIIQNADVDIVGLQEVHKDTIETLTESLGMEYVGLGRDGGHRGQHNPILYKADRIEVLDFGTYWLQGNLPYVPGAKDYGNVIHHLIFTWAKMKDLQNGSLFYVYNTQLDNKSRPSRARSAIQITRHMESNPLYEGVQALMMGDFQVGWRSREYLPFRALLNPIASNGSQWIVGVEGLEGTGETIPSNGASNKNAVVARINEFVNDKESLEERNVNTCQNVVKDKDIALVSYVAIAGSQSDCCRLCLADTECTATTWTNADGGTCYLKSGIDFYKNKTGAISQSICSHEENVEYTGGNALGSKRGKPEECCLMCRRTDRCTSYSWNDLDGGTCYFTNGPNEKRFNPGTVSGSFSVTGNAIPRLKNTCQKNQADTDLKGTDIANIRANSADTCCSLCFDNTECIGYAWIEGTCWLKSTAEEYFPKIGVVASSLCSIENNIDLKGVDIGRVRNRKPSQCCLECRKKAGCVGWSWIDFDNGTCWLKKDITEAVTKDKIISGRFNIVPKTDNDGDVGTPGGGSLTCAEPSVDVDILGADTVIKFRKRVDECCGLCRKEPKCTGWSWNNYLDGTCYLKENISGTKSAKGITSASFCTMETDIDYFGNDIGSEKGEPSECCAHCRRKPGCVAWTWISGVCWLKNDVANKKNVVGLVSGVYDADAGGGYFPPSGPTEPQPSEPNSDVTLTFNNIDQVKNDWVLTYRDTSFNDEKQAYRPNMISVNSNKLQIKAEKVNPKVGGKDYTSGHMYSKRSFLYGTFHIKAKVNMQQGSWAALWTLPEKANDFGGETGWPRGGEMDIMEGVTSNNRQVISSAVHWHSSTNNNCPYRGWGEHCFDFSESSVRGSSADDWHIYHMKWTKDKVQMWIDDRPPHFTITGSSRIPQDKHRIIMNLAIGGTLGGNIDNNKFPRIMEVEYVKWEEP